MRNKGEVMSIQTEIKNEKALFSELIKKIKKSKTFKVGTSSSKAKTYKFDTFDMTIYLDKITPFAEVMEKYLDDDGFYILGAELEFASKIIVHDQKGKSIMERDCRPLDVGGDALKIQKVRYQMVEKVLNTINGRIEKPKEEQKKLEEAKLAAKRLKTTKALTEKLRKEQLKTAAGIKNAVEAIKDL